MTAAEPLPEPPWWTPRKPVSARKAALSREAIVAAARALLPAEGIDGLSMRRVAAELDTGAASLYAHVAHKEELLDLLLDDVVSEIPLVEPDPARWREQLVRLWTDARDALGRNGDIARVALGRIPVGPNSLRLNELSLTILRGGGVPDKVTAWCVDVIGLYVAASAVEGAMFTARRRAGGDPAEYFDAVARHFRSLPAAEFPTTALLVGHLTTGDGDERFAFGLDLLVRGLADMVERAETP